MPYNYDKPFEVRDIRNGEWYWVQKEILSSKQLNASDKLVYSALAYFAHNKTQECFPSYTQIAKLIDLHRTTVIRSIKNLISSRFISKKKKEGRVNFYELLKIASSKILPVSKENQHPSQIRPALVANGTSNNTHITRLNNNSEKIIKIKEKIREQLTPKYS